MSNPTPQEVALNYTTKNRAVLNFPALPNMSMTLKGIPLPGIELPPVETPSPFFQKKHAGDKVFYETLNVVFIVDELLTNWLEIYNWIIGLGAPEDKVQYRGKPHHELDAYMTIYSSHNNPILKVKFLECVPTSLGGLPYEEDVSETEPVETTATFEYLRYEFVPV